MITPSVLCLVALAGISYAFNKEEFLSHCNEKVDIDWKDYDECTSCDHIKLNDKDLEEFKEQSFNISSEECFVFYDGELGVVNGDFFKQFPNAKLIEFKGGRFNLSPSNNGDGNKKLQSIRFENSDITGGKVVGAFSDLINLTTLEIEDIHFEGLSMTSGLKKLFENLNTLKVLSICEALEYFPQGIPNSVEELTICDSKFETLTREHLENFKDLKMLSIYTGNLKTIDENAFDDLVMLEELDLEYNSLEKFPVRHLQKNKNIKRVALDPIEHSDLSEVGLWETSRTGYFVKEDAVEDYNDSY